MIKNYHRTNFSFRLRIVFKKTNEKKKTKKEKYMKNDDKENLQIFSLIWLFMKKLLLGNIYIYI